MPDDFKPRNDEQVLDESMTLADDDADDEGEGNNDEEQPAYDEPDWNEIMQHEPARTEVPAFLTAMNRRERANERFAVGLDGFHESVLQSMDGLVEVVTVLLNDRTERLYEYEVNLKCDYVYNEKTRASMQTKLKESARVAQGLFANLLMRVAQPEEAGGMFASAHGDDLGTAENSGDRNGANASNDDAGEGGEEEPDWDAIMQHEPARSEVPAFLAARSRREAAYSRFEAAIEEFHTSMSGYEQELTQAVADIHNSRTMKLEEYEQILKHDYVSNDKMRAEMQSQLEASATAAHKMFEDLMTRVMQPQSRATGILTQAATLGDSP
ncbi:hypothetical protein ACHAW5_006773 [Stephanodiscus triporus]|uniref:Uncharacterized protein n=1 Tax=Stephanodiscus triporus TaxID=2934178 RepID=A0ABD3NR47_9STRA